MKIILCRCGNHIIVSDEDYDRLRDTAWNCYGEDRVRSVVHRNPISIADMIMGFPPIGFIWDHVDRDIHHNVRSNLRLATNSQNNRNRGRFRNNTSGYKGVHWDKLRGKWQAQAYSDGHRKHLGHFDKKEDAAIAYNDFVKEHYGEFAVLNTITEEGK